MAKMAGLHAEQFNNENFALMVATKFFLEGDLPKLFNYIAGEYAQRGAEEEQERIIKLLEDEPLNCETLQNEKQHKFSHLVFEGVREQFIALIKGENK
jgi:hypothetical protein